MKIGSLGKIVFKVSSNEVKTFNKLSWKGSAKIQEHERHGKKDLPEYVGRGLEVMKFEMRVSRYLGSNPNEDIKKIREYVRDGTAIKLILGQKTYGYKWLISDWEVVFENCDKSGKLIEAAIVINLKEYPKV